MRTTLDQHLFGLLVVLFIVPLCATVFLLAVPFLCFRAYHGPVRRPVKAATRYSIGRREEEDQDTIQK